MLFLDNRLLEFVLPLETGFSFCHRMTTRIYMDKIEVETLDSIFLFYLKKNDFY